MVRFSSLHLGVGGVQFTGITPATADPQHLPTLAARFRRLLIGFPVHFLDPVELANNARIDLQWVSLCPSAGLVLLRSGNPEPDVIGLLLNGLESVADLESVRRHTPMLRSRWDEIDRLIRPTAVNAYFQVSRMLDPAVATVLHAFASAYFELFGTAGP